MKITSKLKRIGKFGLDLLFPIKCLGCGKENLWLCQDCLKKIPRLTKFVCPVCNHPSLYGSACQNCQRKTSLNGLWAACSYEDKLVRTLIKAFKYNFVEPLAKPLAKLLIETIPAQVIADKENWFIVPVPLHPKKLRQRDFNQSELLAEEVAKHFHLSLRDDILKRKINTSPQVDLKDEERKENIKDAFTIIEKKSIKNKKIILVDDVTTTGATLEEAAKTLKEAGVEEVWALVVAKG